MNKKWVINNIHKIGIYIPKEFRSHLNQIKKIVSCSWKEPILVYKLIIEAELNPEITLTRSNETYYNYLKVYHELTSHYMSLDNENKSYRKILLSNGFSDEVEMNLKDKEDRFV
jgi:hypothetical protein